jgi:hypothetical protein
MERFERLSEAFQSLVPFRIRYKDESWEMQLLQALIGWFCPGFLTHYTTVIGSTIYFPDREYIRQNPESAMLTLSHEVVHLLDADRISWPLFGLAYLFPQVLALGALLFPWLGPWSLFFLFFLLPIPSPLRAHFELRAYAIDLLNTDPERREEVLGFICEQFSGWNYYRMYPYPDLVKEQLQYWVYQIESGQEKDIMKVLLVYEWARETNQD